MIILLVIGRDQLCCLHLCCIYAVTFISRKFQNWAKGGSKLGEGEWQIGRRPKHAVWQRKQIWNVYMKEIQLIKKSRTWTMGRRASGRLAEGQVANRPKAETCSLTEETNMKHGYERNIVEQMPRAEVANWPKGKWQIGRREKSSSTAAPSELAWVFSMTNDSSCVDDINSVPWWPLSMKKLFTICRRSSIPRV